MSNRQRLEIEYANAQEDEKNAREAGDRAGVRDAQDRKSLIMMQIQRHDYATLHGDDTDMVVLISPNPRSNNTDSNGVRFENGRAVVPRTLATRYLEFDGYSIEEI